MMLRNSLASTVCVSNHWSGAPSRALRRRWKERKVAKMGSWVARAREKAEGRFKGMRGWGGDATGLTPMGTCSEQGLENTPELTAHGRSVRLALRHCVLSWMDTLLAHHCGSCLRLVSPPPFAPSSLLSLLPFPLISFPSNVFFVPS